jgi:nitrite reductase/ring-hydroxylating ferredoxin subunit/Fe-S cluster biogenesis protein NfuA
VTAAAQAIAATSPDGALTDLLDDLARLETIFESWDEAPRASVEAYRRAIDALHGEALRRLIRTLKSEPAAFAAMKRAVADDVVYAVLRHLELVKPSLQERVEAALEDVRPLLASHGGGVELVSVAPPAIEVRFTGSCDGCAASALTFHAGVKKAVEAACPEITEIVQVKGGAGAGQDRVRYTSPFALAANSAWCPAGSIADIPDGGLRAREVGGENVVLARQGAAVTCFQDACAHLGLPLHDGAVTDGIITCPHHGFRYDLASGECLTAPTVALQLHAVRVIGQRVEVRLSR